MAVFSVLNTIFKLLQKLLYNTIIKAIFGVIPTEQVAVVRVQDPWQPSSKRVQK